MSEECAVNFSPLQAPRPEVFCQACVFYAPMRQFHRCRHVQATQLVKTYAGYVVHRFEPEDKNAQNDCADFSARTWRDTVFPIAAFLVGIPLLWVLAVYGVPWLLAR